MANYSDPNRAIIQNARLSYLHVLQPYTSPNGGEPKYSTTILIPKTDTQSKQNLDAAVQAAVKEGVSGKWNGQQPPLLSIPIHDGDGVRPSDGMPYGEECRGHWVMTASSKNKPQVVDLNVEPIIDPTEIYSGMYARVSVQFYPYNSNGKKGIGAGLGHIQKLRDGEPLGGGRTAEQDFAEFMQQQPAMNQAQPPWQTQYQSNAQQSRLNPLTGEPIDGVYGI